MKSLHKSVVLLITLVSGIGVLTACSEVVEHHESTRANLDGSRTRTESTVRKNPDGTTTIDKDEYHVDR